MDRKAAAEAMNGRITTHVHFGNLETRNVQDGIVFRGVASSVGSPYEMGGYKESVRAGAFKNSLEANPDVVFVLNHGDSGHGMPLSRTSNGTLVLAEEKVGLVYTATCDPEDPDAKMAARKVDQGLLNQNSFAFRVVRQQWDGDYENRELLEVNLHRGDVSIVNNGANPDTPVSVSVRALSEALYEVRAGKTLSDTTMKTLTQVLGFVSAADDGVDQAQIALANLMGVPNPDDDSQWQQNAAEIVEEVRSFDLDLFRARAYALRARALQ